MEMLFVEENNENEAALFFSLGVTMALTDDISIEQVLFPPRLIYALVCGLLPSPVMGQPQWTCSWA